MELRSKSKEQTRDRLVFSLITGNTMVISSFDPNMPIATKSFITSVGFLISVCSAARGLRYMADDVTTRIDQTDE